ncbi:MAG: aspartyl/asparaginyl beta-hydroxylase domain-containing protein [Pseudomonadota bacterium]
MQILLSVKLWIVVIFLLSTMYIHYRGKVRFRFLRQLTDHSTILAPINAFIYLFSKTEKGPFIDVNHFPELNLLRENWQTIRQEALQLVETSDIKSATSYNDAGFNSFFRNGWKRFYIKWYQKAHPSAQRLCPKTLALIEKIPSIKSAMFAQLSPQGKLPRHRDPYAGSLRYHLGLITPNDDNCLIYVDGQAYSWRDGKDVMFDETYIHYAYNNTEQNRVILFCDIYRPMRYKFADMFNVFFSKLLLAAAISPNTEEDRTGFINKAFKYLYAIRRLGKKIKAKNRRVYYLIKYALILLIIYLIFF